MKKAVVLITCVILLLVTVGFSFASWYLLDSGSSHISNIKMDNVEDNYYFGTGDPGTAKTFTITILSEKPEVGTNNFVIQDSNVKFQKSYVNGVKLSNDNRDDENELKGSTGKPQTLAEVFADLVKEYDNNKDDKKNIYYVVIIYDSLTGAEIGSYSEYYPDGRFFFSESFLVRKNYVFYTEIRSYPKV